MLHLSAEGLDANVGQAGLLASTDSPYLGPEKDVQNEPVNVKGTALFAADLWKTTEAAATDQLA